jgi:hypothetical protein
MPSLRVEGFRLIVNTRGERGHQPHVHVIKGGTRVVITLDEWLTPYGPRGMTMRDIARARELVADNLDRLMEWWMYFNG